VSRLAWVDVFAAAGAMSGNPLAVVLDAGGWSDARMQAFAAELGLSETTFVTPSRSGADHRVRIFTPVRELPMAGHPVVGTAWVLHAARRIGERAVLETGAGDLPVRVQGQVATMDQATPEAGPEVDAGEVGAALGAEPLPDPPAQVWSTGVRQLMVRVPSHDALDALRPDHDALARLGERDGWIGVSAYVLPEAADGRLRVDVRHFAPLVGVPEDPVTGSAAGALGACLAAAGVGAGGDLEMVVCQGASLGRAGEVAVRVASQDGTPRRVRVGGRVVPLFEGRVLEEGPPARPDGGR
jgi:trans-2,3-dihydro-3-hydroxyanthranilate isomerase